MFALAVAGPLTGAASCERQGDQDSGLGQLDGGMGWDPGAQESKGL